MKNLLITGSNGYIGAAIRATFDAESWNIFTIGRDKNSQIKVDLGNPNSVMDLDFGTVQFDLCIHVAAAHEVICANDPINCSNINIIGTAAIVQLCIRYKVPRFIYISTIHVFGDNEGLITEESLPIPNNHYGLTHYLAEEIILMHNRKGDFEGTIVRLPNVIGAPNNWTFFNRWSLAPFDFCKQISINRKIILKTHGQQLRHWIDLNDIGLTILKILDNDFIPKLHLPGHIFSILELANKISLEWELLTDTKVDVNVSQNFFEKETIKNFSSNYQVECRYPDISHFVKSAHYYLYKT